MGILLREQNFRDVWRRNKSVRVEIGPNLRTHTHAAKLVVEISTKFQATTIVANKFYVCGIHIRDRMVELTAPGTRSRLYCWQACTTTSVQNVFSGHSWPSSRERGLSTSATTRNELYSSGCFVSSFVQVTLVCKAESSIGLSSTIHVN